MSSSPQKPHLFPLETKVPEEISKFAAANPEILPGIFDVLEKDTTARKFAYDKAIRQISEENPSLLYPYFERIHSLIASKNSFIRWGAIISLANLIPADKDRKSLLIIDRYLGLLESNNMIDAANAANNLWRFVVRFPELDYKVTTALMRTSEHTYLHKGAPSPECGYIVSRNVIDSFSKYFEISGYKREMLGYVKDFLSCPRKAVSKRAEAFIAKHQSLV